jgi:hypothetical protein
MGRLLDDDFDDHAPGDPKGASRFLSVAQIIQN